MMMMMVIIIIIIIIIINSVNCVQAHTHTPACMMFIVIMLLART